MRFPGLGTWVERRAARSPDDVALIAAGVARHYAELAGDVRAMAGDLHRRGIGPGDRLAFHGVNHPAALISFFATTAIGAVWVPIHPGRPEEEVRAVLDDSGARCLVRASPRTHPDTGVPEVEADELAMAGDRAEPLPGWEPDSDDLAILAYTSGTTGAPKGVMLTHANVMWNVVQMVAACSFVRTDVSLAAAPFTRMGGLGVTVLPTIFAGGAIAIPEAADGAGVLETIEGDGVSVVFANPDLLEAMVRDPSWARTDLSGVRTGVVGGGLVPEQLLRTYLDRDVSLLHGYGLTEAAPVVSLLDEREAVSRATSVGRPLPFVEVRALRPNGAPCEPGEVGEWWIRGPNVSIGYWRRPPVRDPEGWFPTGDVGTVDDDGYLWFLDRASSAMRVGDVTVYPATIERAIYGLPGIAEAAAVDVDGRIVVAVVPSGLDGAEEGELLRSLAASLAPGERPSEIRRVTSIPRNASGKVLRSDLRDHLRASGS